MIFKFSFPCVTCVNKLQMRTGVERNAVHILSYIFYYYNCITSDDLCLLLFAPSTNIYVRHVIRVGGWTQIACILRLLISAWWMGFLFPSAVDVASSEMMCLTGYQCFKVRAARVWVVNQWWEWADAMTWPGWRNRLQTTDRCDLYCVERRSAHQRAWLCFE